MKHAYLLLIALCVPFSSSNARAQPSVPYTDELSGGPTLVRAMEEAPGGGWFVAGRTRARLEPRADGLAPSSDAFVARLDARGQLVWVRQWGHNDFEESASGLVVTDDELIVAVAENGNGGFFQGVRRYGSAIVHLDHDGSIQRHFPIRELVSDIARGPRGRLAICGRRLHPTRPTTDFVVSVYSRAGRRQWTYNTRAPRSDESCGAIAWRNNQIVAAGSVAAPRGHVQGRFARRIRTDREPKLDVRLMSRPLYVVSFNPRGGRRWSRIFQGAEHYPGDVAIGRGGTTWITFTNARTLPTPTGTEPNSTHASLVAYDSRGALRLVEHRLMESGPRGRDAVRASDTGALWMVSVATSMFPPPPSAAPLSPRALRAPAVLAVSLDAEPRVAASVTGVRYPSGFASGSTGLAVVGRGCLNDRCGSMFESLQPIH
ncbi:MAG: hypothetical protein AAF411_13670 [Myxococcota bacterium]